MNKSRRTAQRYAASWRGQTTLNNFGFGTTNLPKSVKPAAHHSIRSSTKKLPSPIRFSDDSNRNSHDNTTANGAITATVPCVRQLSHSPSLELDDSVTPVKDSNAGTDDDAPVYDAELETIEAECQELPLDGDDAETWEQELDANVEDPNKEIRSWDELRKQIKNDLKKQSKTLPLSCINQLMILSNFATLQLKGLSRIEASVEIARQWHEGQGNWFARQVRALARHYQIFEQLPKGKRGGSRSARSWLHDERVKKMVLDYLKNLPTGKVTPSALQKHINNMIFPELGIKPKKSLTIRTARRWLIKLGWRHTLVKKGVYMDGHERSDVVNYRNKEFLPQMAMFEARMVHYEGPDMTRVEPQLAECEKEIIHQFHDECCFHANDQSNHAW
jgi:hypothetical protein